jgi:hypothetical protein
VRGGVEGNYPYGFLDVGKIGWMATAGNATAIAVGFLLAGYLIVWLDRRLAPQVVFSILEAAPPSV